MQRFKLMENRWVKFPVWIEDSGGEIPPVD